MSKIKDRVSRTRKEANNYQWYRDKTDMISNIHKSRSINSDGVSRDKILQVNYDLFNNKINLADFEYVCKPFGDGVGELPATMVNRDIVSSKVKALLGMESKRPFDWDVIATNDKASDERTEMEYELLKEYVIEQVTGPVREEIEMRHMQESEGRELTPDEEEQIQQQIAEEIEAMTPENIKRYMERDFKSNIETMTYHLLHYLRNHLDIDRKFNSMFKHGLLSAGEIGLVTILNDRPFFEVVNTKNFSCDMSSESLFIEDGDWAYYERGVTPSQLVQMFGDELTDKDLDKIYEHWTPGGVNLDKGEDLFTMMDLQKDYQNKGTIKLGHATWKSLRKVGFLTYLDENGEEQMKMVDETYEINTDFGDVSIEWEWLPEAYETWKVMLPEPIYLNKRPVPGQFKDIDNAGYCKLSYYGVYHDNMNSEPVSLMDRLKYYQYYYNIIMYRLELLISSDKGKKLLMNINAIPSDAGINVEQWQYFFEATPFGWFNPKEEGMEYNDVNTMAKVVDLSLASDIQKYIEFAEYLRTQAGVSTGITENVEGQVQAREAVRNVQQNLQQSSNIIEGYFQVHDYVKRNILQALIEAAKVAYSEFEPRKLNYIMDDMTRQMFTFDPMELDNSTVGVFIANTTRSEEIRQEVRALAHAAMQNQKIELSDVIAVLKEDNLIEAEETLRVAEERRNQVEQDMQNREIEAQQESEEKAREFLRENHEMEKEKIILKEEERRKTEIIKGGLLGASFNPDIDTDSDGENDFLAIAKTQMDEQSALAKMDIDRRKMDLEEKATEHKIKNDSEKLKLEREKLRENK